MEKVHALLGHLLLICIRMLQKILQRINEKKGRNWHIAPTFPKISPSAKFPVKKVKIFLSGTILPHNTLKFPVRQAIGVDSRYHFMLLGCSWLIRILIYQFIGHSGAAQGSFHLPDKEDNQRD